MGRYVNPFTDTGFKILFGQEPSKPLLRDFLNNLLEGEETITDVTFLDKEKPRIYKKDRGLIYDILCETAKNDKIIVEMQNRSQEYFVERSIYYTSQAIARQGIRGDWDFNFHAVYFIAFMNFTLDALPEFRTDVQLCDTKTHKVISHKMKYVYLQLPRFEKTEAECKTNFDRWIYIFKNMATLERIPWAQKDSIFSQLGKFAQIANLSESQRRKYDKDLKIYRDSVNVLNYAQKQAREEGLAEGREKGLAEGRAEEKINIALKLKKAGADIALIILSTGLSEEEIEKL